MYQQERGAGDGRRVPWGVLPKLCAPPSVHRTWHRSAPNVSIPAVSARGRRLGERVAQRRREELIGASASGGDLGLPPTVDPGRVAAPTVFIVPVTCAVGGVLMLVPAFNRHVIGYADEDASGARGLARAAATQRATELMRRICPPDKGSAPRLAPAAYPVLCGHACVVMTAFIAPVLVATLALSLARLRLRWVQCTALADEARYRVCATAAAFTEWWRTPQQRVNDSLRTGVGDSSVATLNEALGSAALDLRVWQARAQRDTARMPALLREAAKAHPHISDALESWAVKFEAGEEATPPPEVLACAKQPDMQRLAKVPFPHRCEIPDTKVPPPDEPQEPLAPGVPLPATAEDTYLPVPRQELHATMRAFSRWNRRRVAGVDAARPAARSWSDLARLPWYRGRVFTFFPDAEGQVPRRGTLAPAVGPAFESRMHKAAVLHYFRNLRHRRLVSQLIGGVKLADTVSLQTTLAPNLLSLYTYEGGPGAVADESAELKRRGWYQSSAGLGDTQGVERSLTSPKRVSPRGAVPRAGGPPRGIF